MHALLFAACLVRVQLRSKQDEGEKEEREGVKIYMLMIVIVPFLGDRRIGREGRKEGGRKREAYVDLYLCYTVVEKGREKAKDGKRKTHSF